MKLNLFKWRMLLTLIGRTEHRERNRISSTSIWSGWAGNRILNRRSMVRKGFAIWSRRYSTCSPPERKPHPPPCDGWCCWWPPIRTSSARCSITSTTSYLTAMNRLWNTGRCKLNGMQMRSRDWTCRVVQVALHRSGHQWNAKGQQHDQLFDLQNSERNRCILVIKFIFDTKFAYSNLADVLGYTIPKDTLVVYDIYRVHRDGQYWQKPDGFHPEHFLNDDGSLRTCEAFIPFGIGRWRDPLNLTDW